MEDLSMLGQSFLRGIRKKLPWYQNIKVVVSAVHGRSIFLENLSDLEKKRRTVRRYSLVVFPELNHVNTSSKEAVWNFDCNLTALVSKTAILDFKSDELWYAPNHGYYDYDMFKGNATILNVRHL